MSQKNQQKLFVKKRTISIFSKIMKHKLPPTTSGTNDTKDSDNCF